MSHVPGHIDDSSTLARDRASIAAFDKQWKASGSPMATPNYSYAYYGDRTPASQIPTTGAYYGGRYANPSDQLHPWSPGMQRPFPMSSDYANQNDYMRAVQNWLNTSTQAMRSSTWQKGLTPQRTGTGTGGVGTGKGKAINPNAGKVLPGLPPELERWYQEQLSQARTEEQMQIAREELAKRAAMREAASAGRQARALSAGRAVDVGAAMAESGLGASPALLGAAMDSVYGTGRAQELNAEAARMQALQNFLQNRQDILATGRRTKGNLEDWRALQIAALSNKDLANLIGMPTGGK